VQDGLLHTDGVSLWIAKEGFLPTNLAASKFGKCKVLNMKP